MIFTEFLIVYLSGSVLYGSIEILYRGYTHWTMLILGGLCFYIMYLLSDAALPFAAKLLISAAAISLLEFGTGYLVNIIFGWRVWDYSGLPFNLCGQVCPLYTFLWFLLSIPGIGVCTLLRKAMPVLLKV